MRSKRKLSLLTILVTICLLQRILFAVRIDYSTPDNFIDDPLINIVSSESEINKSDKIIKDYDETDGTYKLVYRFYSWWQPTCQHVGHDEWTKYKIYKDGRPPEDEGSMYTFNQMPLNSYNADLHDWEEWEEIERKDPTEKEEGYIKYKRECKYSKGWWATLGKHEPEYKIEILEFSPTPTPAATPLPTTVPQGNIVFVPDSCDWRNTPIDVKVYVNGDTTTKVNDIDTRSYSYTTTTVYPSPSPGRKVTKTNTSSTWWEYTQTWSIGNINVSGTNLGTAQSVTNNSTITLSKDGYDTLKAELNGWVAGSKSWKTGNPPRGSWNSGSPDNTLMPSERYYSSSGTYKIDTIKPVITFDWSNQDNFVNNTHEFIYLPDNKIKFAVSDSLSGIASVEYSWSKTDTPGTYKSMFIQTQELTGENKAVTLNIHADSKKYNLWYLFIRVRDRAGNEVVVQNKINIRAYLYDFRIININDPSWENYFKSGKVIKVNQLPVLEADIKNTIPKKGYNIYFTMNGKGLNENTDKIEITTRFFHTSDINLKSDNEVDLYYKSNNNYIKIGSSEDVRTIKFNKQDIGHFNMINNMPKTIIDSKTSEIKGNFYIPPETIALPKGSSFDYNKRIKDGYLIVNIQINAYKNGELVFSYVAPSNSQWHLEGGPRSSIFYPGDAFVFNNKYSSNDDYNTTINQ